MQHSIVKLNPGEGAVTKTITTRLGIGQTKDMTFDSEGSNI